MKLFIIICKDNANERRISSLLEYFAECSLSSAKIMQIRELTDSLSRFLCKSNKHKRKRNKRAKDNTLSLALTLLYFIQVSQVRELTEVKEVITPYGRSGSEETLVKAEMRVL